MTRSSIWHAVLLYGGLAGLAVFDDPKYIAVCVLLSCGGLIAAAEATLQERMDRQEKAIQNIWERINPPDSDF